MANLEPIREGALVIQEGQITWVGEAANAPHADQQLDFSSRIITPGLIDAHTHPVFGSHRAREFEKRCSGTTYQEIAASGGGIQSTVRATRAASENDLLEQAKKHAKWFLKNGTTTLEAKSGYGLSTEDELKILRVIKALGESTPLSVIATVLAAHAFPPEFQDNKQGYVNLICDEILPRVAKQGLAKFADAFCEDKYFDASATERVFKKAKGLGLGLRIHADQLTNNGGAKLAAKLKAKTADHLEQTDHEGIRALHEAGVQPILLPASVYALGLKKYPDARLMIDEGLGVVLATDFNPGSSPTPSLPFVMSLACTQMGMSPAEALTACTINAARSLDLAHDRGSLEVGKRADFVVWDCEDYCEIPYWIDAPIVQKVFVQGNEVFTAV